MLKRKYMFRCMILFLCFAFVLPLELKAETNKTYNKEKKIEGNLVRKTTFTSVSISKGKYYSLKRFIGFLKNSSRHDVSDISSDMKKDTKAILSGKGLTVRKNSFKAVKTGTFQLKIKVNGSSYVIPLRVVEPYYQMNFQEVRKISIKKYVMWKSTKVFIEDMNKINRIMYEINRARYSFDVHYSLLNPLGCDDFFISLYSEDGRTLESIVLCPHKIVKSRATWMADSSTTKECFDYISAVYNDAFSKLPEHVRDC